MSKAEELRGFIRRAVEICGADGQCPATDPSDPGTHGENLLDEGSPDAEPEAAMAKYGWRDRPPTSGEVEAHDKEYSGPYAGAPWAVRVKPSHPYDDPEWGIVWHTPNAYAPWSWNDVHKEADYFDSWRPVTRGLWSAPWPEVKT